MAILTWRLYVEFYKNIAVEYPTFADIPPPVRAVSEFTDPFPAAPFNRHQTLPIRPNLVVPDTSNPFMTQSVMIAIQKPSPQVPIHHRPHQPQQPQHWQNAVLAPNNPFEDEQPAQGGGLQVFSPHTHSPVTVTAGSNPFDDPDPQPTPFSTGAPEQRSGFELNDTVQDLFNSLAKPSPYDPPKPPVSSGSGSNQNTLSTDSSLRYTPGTVVKVYDLWDATQFTEITAEDANEYIAMLKKGAQRVASNA